MHRGNHTFHTHLTQMIIKDALKYSARRQKAVVSKFREKEGERGREREREFFYDKTNKTGAPALWEDRT